MVLRRRFNGPLTPLVCAFLLPSAVFWTSCIHREGILFMLLGFFLTGFDRLLTMGFDRLRIIRCLLLLVLIAYVRDFVAILMIPPLLVWAAIVSPAARRRLALVMAAVTIALVLLILFLPGFDLPGFITFITRRQQEFFFLEGHSRLYLPTLDGSWQSLLHELPIAVLNGLFEPLPGSGGRSIYLLFSIELAIIWLIAVWALITLAIHRHPASRPTLATPKSSRPASPSPISPAGPFALFCILFSLTGMLLIGIVIPFAGAIVRYRSIYLPFLLALFLHTLGNLQPFRLLNAWLSDRVINKL
jgi:hypothetical protein